MPALPKEDVLDYPRPPALEAVDLRFTIDFAGKRILDHEGGFRVLETYHPPTYYIPEDAFAEGVLRPVERRTRCEWKGEASYFDIVVGDQVAAAAAWTYRDPVPGYEPLAGHVAVYAEPMGLCTVGGHSVIPQPGNFYGGWVTPNISGPIKGASGTNHW